MNAKPDSLPPSAVITPREKDFHSWAMETAQAVRERRFINIEWDAIAEELEDMGRSEERALESQLARLVAHLLKWQFQPEQRQQSQNSWRATIKNARKEVRKLLKRNPGLQTNLAEYFTEAYSSGIEWAVIETNLPDTAFPAESPWTLSQVLDDDFWPKI